MRTSFLLGFPLAAAVTTQASELSSPEELVDPFIGSVGQGSCMPGPCLPHASIYPSPETLKPKPSGYSSEQPIVGFAQLHTQGTGGNPSYGNFLVTPQLGLAISEAGHASPKMDEIAKAYAYHVHLTKDDIVTDIVPTLHSALYRFQYTAGDQSFLTLDVARKVGGVIALEDGSVQVDSKTGTITGGGRFTKNWNPAPYQVYFAARVSAAPTEFGTWQGTTIQPSSDQATTQGRALGAYVRFSTTQDQPVYLKIAVSFESIGQAQHWRDTEIPNWDFEGLKAAASARWRRELSALTIETPSHEEAVKVFTRFWDALVQPRDRTGDVAGYDPAQPLWDDHYTLWDTWKTLFPLMAILHPEMVRDNIRSFIHRYHVNHEGYVAEAFIQGREFKVGQGGNETDNVIADAFAKGVEGVDWEKAYAILKYHADQGGRTAYYRERGWMASNEKTDYSNRIRSGSATLAFAYNDYNAAQVARGLGKQEDYEKYLRRSQNWRNVWDDTLESDGFTGFVRGRSKDGNFSKTAATKGFNTDFYEGICWEFPYDVPHDVPGLIEKRGGGHFLTGRLTNTWNHAYIHFDNEPSFMTVWLFDQVKRPYLTSYCADKLRALYPAHDLPGDDDSGAMSSLYVFLTAGFFPIAGQDVYFLHGARIPKLEFHLPNGKTFTVLAENAGGQNIFIQSATLNGKSLDQPKIHHRDIVDGGTLRFVMGPEPSAWGTEGEFDAAIAKRELTSP